VQVRGVDRLQNEHQPVCVCVCVDVLTMLCWLLKLYEMFAVATWQFSQFFVSSISWRYRGILRMAT